MSSQTTPDTALSELLDGNRRFMQGAAHHPNSTPTDLQALAKGQHPKAIVFGCSDSRFPPEVIFDQGVGDVFVVRTAGHSIDDAVLGTLEYGVNALGIPLLLVLSHVSCGAVTAAVGAYRSGERPDGYIAGLVDQITPSVQRRAAEQNLDDVDEVTREHLLATLDLLPMNSPSLAGAVAEGRLSVVGGICTLDDGSVEMLRTLDA